VHGQHIATVGGAAEPCARLSEILVDALSDFKKFAKL